MVKLYIYRLVIFVYFWSHTFYIQDKPPTFRYKIHTYLSIDITNCIILANGINLNSVYPYSYIVHVETDSIELILLKPV